MSWKDFFFFNKRERNGIIVLLCLIVGVLVFSFVYQKMYRPPVYDFSEFALAADDFEQRMKALRLAEESAREYARRERLDARRPHIVSLSPRPFNPNDLPEEEWKEMGMPARLITTIKNFENAGGVFRNKEDLQRIFGMTPEIYAQLEPFIELPTRSAQRAVPPSLERFAEATHARQTARNIMINLNRADTLELIQLRGIGPAFSRRIVSYRDRLGGFHSADQLLEVFGMDTSRLYGFRNNIYVDTSLIRQININTAQWEDLVRHPYIDRNVANSILALRRQHGPFQTIDKLKKSHLITPQLFERLSPYIAVQD